MLMQEFSVLISLYEKEKPIFFNEAMKSIWYGQTRKPSEIVLVLDGKLPDSLIEIVSVWVEILGKKLKIIDLEKNVGLGAALNIGLEHCHYDLVARMDTDDVALSERFSRQVSFMEENLDVVASSAQLEEWDEGLDTKLQVRTLPCKHKDLLKLAQVRSPLSHPLAIFRKEAVQLVGGYPQLRKAQDYALWSLLLQKGYKLANLPDILLRMRTGSGLFERRGWEYFRYETDLLKFQYEIGFISYYIYLRNIFLKACLRYSPGFVKRLAYKYAR